MIYISTGQFNLGFEESIKKINLAKIKNIELSCGKYVKDPIPKIIKLSKKYNLLIHNYFPRPKKDFVINLSSNNKIIKKLSYDHIKKNISLSAKIGAKFLSFHAGFLFDPNYTHLGKTFDLKKIQSRSDAINSFIHNVNKLSKYAEREKVNLLIENNVITKKNLIKFRCNPFLMTNTNETLKIMKKIHKNTYLLVDLAHLKISANTEKFSKINFLKKLDNWIYGYHFSDNDSINDTNKKIKIHSWFWKYIKKNLNYYSLEINFKKIPDIAEQYKLLNKKLKQC